MERLRHRDLDGVLRIAGETAELGEAEAESFPEPLLESLRLLIGSDRALYSELDRVNERILARVAVGGHDRADTRSEEQFWSVRREWPTCAHQDRTLDFSPHRLSDFVTTRELHRRRIYAEYLRPFEHEIDVGLPAALTHTKVFVFFNGPERGDFGERERKILQLLRPHLIRRYEQVQVRRRTSSMLAALETSDEPLVLLDDSDCPEFATPRARRLLASYGYEIADVPNVPGLLARPIASKVLLLEERRPLGLTPREREVLALVAEGQTNTQIGRTLWISPATVGKHLENAYVKLGVTSRTAAVRLMRERHPPAPRQA